MIIYEFMYCLQIEVLYFYYYISIANFITHIVFICVIFVVCNYNICSYCNLMEFTSFKIFICVRYYL